MKSIEIERRCNALLEAVRRTRADERGPLFAPQTKALADMVEAVLVPRGEPAERLRRLVAAERAWHVLTTAIGQRVGSPFKVALAFADRCARDGYAAMIRGARMLGVERRREEPLTLPLVVLEPMASPATFVAGRAARVPSFAGTAEVELPFPMVLLPANNLSCVWLFTVIQHEVGHDVDDVLGITDELRRAVALGLQLDEGRHEVWSRWMREIVADALALGFAGPAFGLTLHRWLSTLGLDGYDTFGTHPPPRPRLALAHRLLEHAAPAAATRLVELRDAVMRADDPWLRDVEPVASFLHGRRLGCLGGATLADLFPAVEAELDATERIAHRLRESDGPIGDANGLPFRLLPSVAEIAMRGVGDSAELAESIHARALSCTAPEDEPIMPARQVRFLEDALPRMLAPILDEERDMKKVPPIELIERHEHMAFVGATNDQLARPFETWLARSGAGGGKRKKKSVEVFFLQDALLDGLASEERTFEHLCRKRKQALDALPSLLDRVADWWAIYEYDRPFAFASYWDWSKPGGRIHVSNHVWGTDLQYSPAVDHTWPPGRSAPGYEYTRYCDGLVHLRHKFAKRLAGTADAAPLYT